jgi:hypothetical protein
MISANVLVSSTATRLAGSGTVVSNGARVLIRNSHATDALIVGGSDVAAGNGFSIPAGQTLDIGRIGPGDGCWAIRGAGNDITAQVLAAAS